MTAKTGTISDPKRGAKGRFGAGNMANPHGRPRNDKEFEALCQRLSIDSLKRIEEIITKAEDTNPNLMKAIQFVADRGWGKARQRVELTGTVDIANAIKAVETD